MNAKFKNLPLKRDQINDKWLSIKKCLKFEFWILFGIDSPPVHHFVRALTFDIISILPGFFF